MPKDTHAKSRKSARPRPPLRSSAGVRGSTFELACGGVVWRDDLPGGRRVLVVHRESYDDWSLPKGKYEPDEDATVIDCALREVLEETGVRARAGGFIGQTIYLKKGRPKLVLFWDMEFVRARTFSPNDEIAEVAWLAPERALKRLTHKDERRVLAAALKAPSA